MAGHRSVILVDNAEQCMFAVRADQHKLPFLADSASEGLSASLESRSSGRPGIQV